MGSQHELTETLIFLVEAGADVYARDDLGRTVSQLACCRRTKWYNSPCVDNQYPTRRGNHDLRLKEIWIEVLSACGYDPEEVISASVRAEELSDGDSDSSLNLYEETSIAASDCSEGDDESMSDEEGESDMAADDVDNDSMPNQDGESNVSAEDVIARQSDAVTPHHYENLLLEGDAEVWSS